MKKFLKIIGILAGLGVLLIAVAIVALRLMYPPEKIKAIVLEKAQTALGREVRLESASLGLFSGITLKGFQLSESHTFQQGTFLEAAEFVVKPDFFALLKKKFIIQSLSLKSPRVSVLKRKDGTFNFSDLTQSKPAAKKSQGEPNASGSLSLIVGRLDVSDGSVSYHDQSQPNTALSIQSLALNARALSLSKPFSAQLSFQTKGKWEGRPVDGSMSFDGRLVPADLVLGRIALEIKKLAVRIPGLGLEASGKVENLDDPKWDVTVSLTEFVPDKLKSLVAFPEGFSFPSAPQGSLRVAGRLAEMSVQGNLAVGAIRTALQGKLQALGTPRERVDLTLKVDPFALSELGKFSADARAMGLSGTLTFQPLRVSGSLNDPKVQGGLTIQKLSHQNFSTSECSLDWNITQSVYPKVSGTANLKTGPGELKDLDKLLAQNPKLRALFVPILALQKAEKSGLSKLVQLPSLSEIKFNKITGDYVADKGLTTVKTFRLEGPVIDVNTQGTVNLTTEALNLATILKVVDGSIRGSAAQILAGPDGIPTLKMKITGTISAPQAKVETKDVQKKAVSELLKSEDTQKVLKKGQDLFKGIFK